MADRIIPFTSAEETKIGYSLAAGQTLEQWVHDTAVYVANTDDKHAPPPAPTYSFVYSSVSTRTNPVPLAGATVSGNIYSLITPTTNVTKVVFSLDGAVVRTESVAPFDFGGTAAPGGTTDPANAWNTASVANGAHTLSALLTLADGVVS